ncbi:MAG TPA: hypothetical protein VMF51_21755 [Nocardioides sp.]|jgi:hypothetical protein|uniref:hypothetical protein n=1 Tax=Nocardioides sp. TaxID=35761 RepID=UPI002C1AA967|nr:hypothetical protein [Nocardioides sp.]HTW17767.1 hypothetical protein [Nocardioides sp.]
MTLKTLPARSETLRAVIAEADRRLDGHLPMDVEGVAENFGDELTLLGAFLLRWHARLSGRIEREILLDESADLESAVVTAWRAAAADLPGVRAVLDRYRELPLEPALAAAVARGTINEHAMLAVTAGLAAPHDASAARIGARLEAQARATYAVPPRERTRRRASFLGRLRSALAV